MSGAILITGVNGFFGSHCVERYSQEFKTEVIAVWQSNKSRLLVSPPSHIHYVQCDLTDQLAVQALFSRWDIDRVFHAAALLPDGAPGFLDRAVRSNIVATANLVECAAKAGSRRFVYCSSISVYGCAPCPDTGWEEDIKFAPSCIYGWSKHAGEECLRLATSLSGLTGVSLRLAGIHGRGRNNGAVYNLIQAACNGKPLTTNNSNNRFQLLHIDDAVELSVRALESDFQQPYRCFNTASHVFPSIRFMAEQIVDLCKSPSQIIPSNIHNNKEILMNTQKIMKELSYTPRPLRDCLSDFIKKQYHGC
jgi:UDP-glucuronate 4-epimerase